jgi:hypothetical protein
MKYRILAFAFPLTSISVAAICPIEPIELKPLPPIGYSDMVHACACDSTGLNCGWVWVAVNGTSLSNTAPDISSALANYNPSGLVMRNWEAAARAELLRQQAQALALENQARLNEFDRQEGMNGRNDRIEGGTKTERSFLASMRQSRANHPDFNAIVYSLQPTPAMQKAIFRSRVDGELAYWLGKNPEECRRIAALSDGQQKRELEKIERLVAHGS